MFKKKLYKKKKLNFYLILILLSICSSCIKQFTDPNLNINNKTLLIIEGCINNIPYFNMDKYDYPAPTMFEQYDSYVRIQEFNLAEYKTNNLDVNNKYITDALVILKDDMGNIDTLKTPLNSTYKIFKNRYAFNFDYKLQKMNPIEGHRYFLEVYYKGNKYTAQTTIPKNRPIIDSFVVEPNLNVRQDDNGGYSELEILSIDGYPSKMKTAFFLKDIPNEFNYYIFKPFNYKYLDLDPTLNERKEYNFRLDTTIIVKLINEKSFKYLDGWQTNVISDEFLSSSYSNKIHPFLSSAWLGKRYSKDVESKSFHIFNINKYEQEETYYYRKFISNNPDLINANDFRYLYDNIYKDSLWNKKNFIGQDRNIFYGTIDKDTYTFFKKLKDLYINDGGSFSPTPFTPQTNIQGANVFGFFYGVNAFVFNLISDYPCVAYINGVHKFDKNLFIFYDKQLSSIQDSYYENYLNRTHFETPPYSFPFNNYK